MRHGLIVAAVSAVVGVSSIALPTKAMTGLSAAVAVSAPSIVEVAGRCEPYHYWVRAKSESLSA